MISCPSCSADNDDAAKYCSQCRAALSPELAATITPETASSAAGNSVYSSLSQSSHHGRFLPGAKVAGRYRIVSIVGKGGMGEVYRADDLKLGHTVALKFLPTDLAKDPQRLEYFHSEVRLTRQISHPNVCRVYDIGEVDGQHFLSMEYIDGEDLKALLRRIGRLPRDKGVQIAQQLCAGLAAAHEAGVLHRDLKPANVMLDGRGQVRITDFGLAKLARDETSGEVAGTPAYMAPEQLSRGTTTIQSDLYALGLILHEVFTGQAVYKASSIPELLQEHEHSSHSQPSGLVDDMDPVVERAILRCLEREPQDRPRSARAVAASLPGGDPLAAAIAAGETPSPEMVAASGQYTSLQPRVAIGLLVGVVVGLVIIAGVAGPRRFVSSDGVIKPPLVLREIATNIVRDQLGYDEKPRDTAHGFTDSQVRDQTDLQFWYRQRSDWTLNHLTLYDEDALEVYGRTTFQVPAWQAPGDLGVKLSASGRLKFFRAIPPIDVSGMGEASDPSALPWTDWFPEDTTGFVLSQAGSDTVDAVGRSDASVLEMVADQIRTTPDASDAIRIWHGVDQRVDQEVYVVAGAFRQRPVYYEVFTATEFEQRGSRPVEFGMVIPRQNRDDPQFTAMVASANALLIAAAILAFYNIRMGRGDRRGAFRCAAYAFCIMSVAAVSMAHAVSLTTPVFPLIAHCVLDAAFLWLMYMALEPFVRRMWPQMLVPWSRLVAGRIHDPAVGHSLLVAVFAGVCVNLNAIVIGLIMEPSGVSFQVPVRSHAYMLSSMKEVIGYIGAAQIERVLRVAFMLLLLSLVRSALRRERLALLATWPALTVLAMIVVGIPFDAVWGWYFAAVGIAIDLGVLVRFGFLAAAVTVVTQDLLGQAPLTLESDQWYYPHGLLVMTVVFLVAAFGCYTSLGGRAFFRGTEMR